MRGQDRRVETAEVGQRPVVETRTVERRSMKGKSFRIKAELLGGRIEAVVLTGDFFLEPEESIYRLESALTEAAAASGYDEARALIRASLGSAKLTGIAVEDLADAVLEVRR